MCFLPPPKRLLCCLLAHTVGMRNAVILSSVYSTQAVKIIPWMQFTWVPGARPWGGSAPGKVTTPFASVRLLQSPDLFLASRAQQWPARPSVAHTPHCIIANFLSTCFVRGVLPRDLCRSGKCHFTAAFVVSEHCQ